ncbi:MAG: peptide ABC transporter [Deltaproteobacteria bacterium RBG_13_52_11b]|nr:MAG: peptide ABC transporter [Deltaproteobacteria bacterium RBG_13_52_11b]
MIGYIVRRTIQAVTVLILVTLVVFLAMRMLPGDPLTIYIVQHDIDKITPEFQAQLMHKFGLDKSLPMQYLDWMSGLFRADFGRSIQYNESVTTLMAERLPVTLYLGLLSFAIASVLGMLAGLLAAIRRGRMLDTIVTSLANLGICTPSFWLGILMIYGIGLKLGWLPIQGYTSPFDNFWLSIRQSVMPVFILSAWGIAFVARQARSSMLEVTRQDYIRTAWSKGLRERVVVMRHMLKNGLIPVVAVMGVRFSHTIGGMVVIENVFNIPGMGRLMVAAVFGQDYQVVQAGILIMAIGVVLTNLVVDISYGWIDPRVRYD